MHYPGTPDVSNIRTSIRKATNLFLLMHARMKKEDVKLTTAFWYWCVWDLASKYVRLIIRLYTNKIVLKFT